MPRAEWASATADLPPPPEFEREFTAPPAEAFPDSEAAICMQTFTLGLTGRGAKAGQRFKLTDPIVTENLGFFRRWPAAIES